MKLQISGEYRVYYILAQSTVTFSSSSSLSFYLSFHSFLSFYLPSGTCNSQVATAAVAACCRTQRSPSRLGGSATAINFAATFVCLPMRCSCPPRVASLPHLALASPPASQCEKCASRSAFGDSKRSKRIYLAAAFSASIRLGWGWQQKARGTTVAFSSRFNEQSRPLPGRRTCSCTSGEKRN